MLTSCVRCPIGYNLRRLQTGVYGEEVCLCLQDHTRDCLTATLLLPGAMRCELMSAG